MEPSAPPAAPARRAGPGLPAQWRPARTRAVLLAAAAAVIVVLVAIAVDAPHDGGSPWSPLDRGAVGGCGILFGAVLWMLSRPRVLADEHGLTVVNMVRTYRYSWPQVVRVNLRQGDPWASLDLADGTSVPALGIQMSGGRDQAVRAARELRDLIEDAEAREPAAEG